MDFEKDVIARSHETIVVVDFWAPWCGPCRVLGPVIEELAAEAQGRWELVKVNVDENQDLSQKYNVRGIPAVKMFAQGNVIAEFNGALPKVQIQQWLDQHIPDPRKLRLQELIAQLDGPGRDSAIAALSIFVNENKDLKEGRLQLARAIALDEPEAALGLIDEGGFGAEAIDTVEDIKTLARFISHDFDEGLAVEKPLKIAVVALEALDFDAALEHLIKAVMIDKSYDRDLPRKTAIAIFHYLGAQHPMTRKHRRMFDMALY